MGRVALRKVKKASPFRKIAMGTWRSVGDPSVYSILYVDMKKSLEFAKTYGEKHKVKITTTHLVGKAVAFAMSRRPEINGMIRGSRIYLRKNVSVFFQINVPGGGKDKVGDANLSGCVLHQAENLSLAEIALQLNRKKAMAMSDKDPEFGTAFAIVKILPWFLIRLYLNIGSFLNYGLNLNLAWAGFPNDPFGSVMVTNVGSLGTDVALAPLVPYSRVPILLALGSIRDQPVAVDGKVEIRPMLPVGVTIDHRMVDGIHGAQMNKDFKDCFEDPEKFFS